MAEASTLQSRELNRSSRHSARGGRGKLLAMLNPSGPYAIRVAATLRLADLMAQGLSGLHELAHAASVDADALGRLLRFLISRGIFQESTAGQFHLNDAAELLQEGHPTRLREWLDLTGAAGRMDGAWPALLSSIRSGKPAYPAVYGRSFWDDLRADETLSASFDSLMASSSKRIARDVVELYDWSRAESIIDVGGGNGALLAEILGAYPQLRGAILELPQVAVAAQRHLAAAGVAQRCSVIVGSFFDSLPYADAYILANVLHDWNEEHSEKILRQCAIGAGRKGHVLIVERVMSGVNQHDATEDDLRMLLVFGGRARTLEQFGALASSAGLKMVTATRAPCGVSILECVPDVALE